MNDRGAARRHLPAVLALAAAAVLLAACAQAGAPAAVTPAPASSEPRSGTTLPAAVSVAEAAALRDAGAFILDVRQPDEWAAVHIPGAKLIPLGDLAGRLAEVPRDRDVVVVCRSGNRSQQGRDILRGAGFTRVTSMTGGVREWQAAGLPTESGG